MQISNENVPPHQDVITSVYVYSWRCINFGPNDEAKINEDKHFIKTYVLFHSVH